MKRTIVNPVFKDSITFLETASETNGEYAVHELTVRPGGGNLMHFHTSFTETFIAVKGILGIQLKDRIKLLLPGESHTVQKNEVHHFFNPAATDVIFRVIHRPGHKGMENMLRIMYGLASDGLTNKKGIPKNLYTLALLGEMGDSRVAGSLSLLNPLFAWLAGKARKKGMENRLLEKYCR